MTGEMGEDTQQGGGVGRRSSNYARATGAGRGVEIASLSTGDHQRNSTLSPSMVSPLPLALDLSCLMMLWEFHSLTGDTRSGSLQRSEEASE